MNSRAARPLSGQHRRVSQDHLDVLALLADGHSEGEISCIMGRKESDVVLAIQEVCARVGVATPIQAVLWAVREELI